LYPGALGADKESDPWVDLKIVEDKLSSNNPGPYFVNVTMLMKLMLLEIKMSS